MEERNGTRNGSRHPIRRLREVALAQGVALAGRAEQIPAEARALWHDVRHDQRWREVGGKMRKPWVGATIAGAAVLVAGAALGAAQTAVAAVTAYAVFRMLRKRERLEEGEQRVERG